MQPNIHPDYHSVTVTCSCGHVLETRSTVNGEALSVETCSQCHPFYTGKQRTRSNAGRMKEFENKYARFKKQKTD